MASVHLSCRAEDTVQLSFFHHPCSWGYALSTGVSRTPAAPPAPTLSLKPVSPQVQCCAIDRVRRLLTTPSLRSEFSDRQRKGLWKTLPFAKASSFHLFALILSVGTPMIHREPSFLKEQHASRSKECSIPAADGNKTRTSQPRFCLYAFKSLGTRYLNIYYFPDDIVRL